MPPTSTEAARPPVTDRNGDNGGTLECGDLRRFLFFFLCKVEKKESGGDRRTPKFCPIPPGRRNPDYRQGRSAPKKTAWFQ
jgi:hypothetical protein